MLLYKLLYCREFICLVILALRYGEIVDVNLVRDKGTGKSKGFAFLAYEDQRSTNLAVGWILPYHQFCMTKKVCFFKVSYEDLWVNVQTI